MIISNQPFHLQKFQKDRQRNSSGSSDVYKQFALEHTYHVKKPECPARPSSVAVLLRTGGEERVPTLTGGDEWPKWLFFWKKPRAGARGSSRTPWTERSEGHRGA